MVSGVAEMEEQALRRASTGSTSAPTQADRDAAAGSNAALRRRSSIGGASSVLSELDGFNSSVGTRG